jgi:hypothetical protein
MLLALTIALLDHDLDPKVGSYRIFCFYLSLTPIDSDWQYTSRGGRSILPSR